MFFYYEDSMWVEEDALHEMARLVVEEDMTPQTALNVVSCEWEDDDYYAVGRVEDQILSYVQKLVDEWK